MKKFRQIMLVLLLFTGGYSATVPVANAQVYELGKAIVGGLGRLLGISSKTAKNAAMIKVVKEILQGTGAMDKKLAGLNEICGGMNNDIDSLWRATNTYYNDLKLLSGGVQEYRDMLNFIGHTRDIQGYCGAAINLTSRSKYLTLAEYEYVLNNAVSIQEYSFNHLKKLYSLVSQNGTLKMSDYERLQMLKELSDEQAKVLGSARNLVVYVKRAELRHENRVKDDAFRESFLNMRL